MENEEGLLTKWLRRRKFRKQFTADEWDELEQVKKQAFMKRMKELAKEDGEKLAVKELKSIFDKNKDYLENKSNGG